MGVRVVGEEVVVGADVRPLLLSHHQQVTGVDVVLLECGILLVTVVEALKESAVLTVEGVEQIRSCLAAEREDVFVQSGLLHEETMIAHREVDLAVALVFWSPWILQLGDGRCFDVEDVVVRRAGACTTGLHVRFDSTCLGIEIRCLAVVLNSATTHAFTQTTRANERTNAGTDGRHAVSDVVTD